MHNKAKAPSDKGETGQALIPDVYRDKIRKTGRNRIANEREKSLTGR